MDRPKMTCRLMGGLKVWGIKEEGRWTCHFTEFEDFLCERLEEIGDIQINVSRQRPKIADCLLLMTF